MFFSSRDESQQGFPVLRTESTFAEVNDVVPWHETSTPEWNHGLRWQVHFICTAVVFSHTSLNSDYMLFCLTVSLFYNKVHAFGALWKFLYRLNNLKKNLWYCLLPKKKKKEQKALRWANSYSQPLHNNLNSALEIDPSSCTRACTHAKIPLWVWVYERKTEWGRQRAKEDFVSSASLVGGIWGLSLIKGIWCRSASEESGEGGEAGSGVWWVWRGFGLQTEQLKRWHQPLGPP